MLVYTGGVGGGGGRREKPPRENCEMEKVGWAGCRLTPGQSQLTNEDITITMSCKSEAILSIGPVRYMREINVTVEREKRPGAR